LATLPEGRLEIEAVKSNVLSGMFGSGIVEVTQGWSLYSSSSSYYYYYYSGVKIEEYEKCIILSTNREDMYVCK